MAHHLDTAAHIHIDELCRVIEATHMIDKYFTLEQLTAIQINAQQPNTPDPKMFEYMGKVFAEIGGGPG